MKALGMIRGIDELGRVVIPKEIRDHKGWAAGARMEMFMSAEGLVMKEYGVDQNTAELVNASSPIKIKNPKP